MLVLGTGVGVTWGIWWGSGTRVGWLVEKTANRGLVGTGNGLAPVSWLSQSKGKAFERKRGGKKKKEKTKVGNGAQPQPRFGAKQPRFGAKTHEL